MIVKLKRRSGAKKKQVSAQTAPARLLARRPPVPAASPPAAARPA
jgi:hypothetical protein